MGQLAIFPPYGIDQTIHVAVLIGMLLLLGLTEWFGWVFSGLVVPGYLASLFVIEPASACAVLLQAVLTFLLARLLSNLASRSGAWNAFFGRERFLLIVFVSIAVRQACAMWLFPDTLRLVDETFGTTFRYEVTLSSVGLVLVPLTANMFWKLGLRRGSLQVAVPTAITYVVLAFVLLPYTNLSFSRLELTYENVALDFLSSPKAYILLLCGAYLASRYNLLYGWDYAGVLVPALIGLGWVSPHRLVTTLAETLLLVLCVRVITRAPGLRTMNLEGPRKIALVFAISFLLKWMLGWFVGPTLWGFQVTDLFGLGYMLSSLLAVKILQKDTTPRIVVPTLLVSVATFVVGSIVGFGLDKLAPAPPPTAAIEVPAVASPATTQLARTPAGVLGMAHVRARLDAGPAPRELAAYRALWRELDAWLVHGGGMPAGIDQHAAALGLAIRPTAPVGTRTAWALVEREERLALQVGWDTAVLVPGAPGPVIAVPSAGRESPSAEASAVLCARVACRCVIASGVDTDERVAHVAARHALHGAMFEVRADASLAVGHVMFHVAKEAPDVNVSELWPHGLELSWSSAGGDHLGASVLRANPRDLWQLLADPAIPVTHDVSLEAWYAQRFAVAPSEATIGEAAPSHSELRFLEAVVAPAALARDLDRAQAMAKLVGYSVEVLADGLGPGKGVWIVGEAEPRTLGWGVLAGRVDRAAPLAIEVPRPRREAGTGRLAVELFHHANASALILADGRVPPDRADADPASPWNTATAFQAFHQAAHDTWRPMGGATLLQVRGFGVDNPVRDAVVLVFSRALRKPDDVPPEVAKLVENQLGALGPLRVDDGARELVDLAGTGNPQLAYCARFETATCALLWFSDAARDQYRDADREREVAKLARLQIRPTSSDAVTALLDPPLVASEVADAARAQAVAETFATYATIAETYATEGNIHLLRRIPATALRVGYSDELGRPFLVLEVSDGDLVQRGIIPLPGGAERVERQASETLATELPAVIARRPRIVTVAGKRGTP